jgi:hypothetical protein
VKIVLASAKFLKIFLSLIISSMEGDNQMSSLLLYFQKRSFVRLNLRSDVFYKKESPHITVQKRPLNIEKLVSRIILQCEIMIYKIRCESYSVFFMNE